MSDTPRTNEFKRTVGVPWWEFAGQLERELAASQAGQAELLARLEEARTSHLHAAARDVQTIQRQAVELAKWQALAEGLAVAANEYMDKCPADADETTAFYAAGLGLSQALAAQEAAKSANHD
jgi:hypothetical protein